jgi:hypothetical protein
MSAKYSGADRREIVIDDDLYRALEQLFRQATEEIAKKNREEVSVAVLAALAEKSCPLDPKQRRYAVGLYNVIHDLGDGNIDAGLRVFRDNQMFTRDVRRNTKGYKVVVITAALVAIVSGAVMAAWQFAQFVIQSASSGRM